MKSRKIRSVSLLLTACILLGSIILPVRADNPGGVKFLNTYVNTGNQRKDILGVAMSQVGYEEKFETLRFKHHPEKGAQRQTTLW